MASRHHAPIHQLPTLVCSIILLLSDSSVAVFFCFPLDSLPLFLLVVLIRFILLAHTLPFSLTFRQTLYRFSALLSYFTVFFSFPSDYRPVSLTSVSHCSSFTFPSDSRLVSLTSVSRCSSHLLSVRPSTGFSSFGFSYFLSDPRLL